MPRQEDWFQEYFDINRNKSNITKVFFFFYFFFDSGGWYAIVCWPFLFCPSLAKPNQTQSHSHKFLNCMHNNDFASQIKACHRLAKCKYAAHLIFTICLNFLVQTYLKWNQFRHFVVLCVFAVQVLTLLHEWWRWGAESGSWNQVASTNLSIHTPKIDYFAWLLWEHFNKWNSVEWIDIGWINVTTWAEEMRRESDW